MKQDKKEEFTQLLESLALSRGLTSVFTDFLDYCIYTFSLGSLNEDILRLQKNYNEDEIKCFPKILQVLGEIQEENMYYDFLGTFYMNNISRGNNGQYFTNSYIASFMAELVDAEDSPSDIVLDPTCGSGVMLLGATRKFVRTHPNERIVCCGSDIDLNCVKMTTVNLAIHSIPGEVAWMDALTMEHWRSYFIELVKVCGMWIPKLSLLNAGSSIYFNKPEDTTVLKKGNEQLCFDF